MFSSLTKNLTNIFQRLRAKGFLTEGQVDDVIREIRIALLESDVSLSVVREIIARIREKSLKEEISKAISPDQVIMKILYDEIYLLLSHSNGQEASLILPKNANAPVNILMIGLQGAGKTTACAKLAAFLNKAEKRKILLVSLDIYRPAAQKQLEILANSINTPFFLADSQDTALEISRKAKEYAANISADIVIYDTAGRLDIDKNMIEELKILKDYIKPSETILVVDSMLGQVAAEIGGNFEKEIGISGIILSRVDGDAKGGAALSVKYVTGKPIKFLSSGENIDSLEYFSAERIAARILDQGDIMSLVEKAQNLFDQEGQQKTLERFKKGKFDLNDYLSQIKSIKKLGGISSILNLLPGAGQIKEKLSSAGFDKKIFSQQEAIILSMTKKERRNPDILNASRKRRVAKGSGTEVQQINILLKQFKQASDFIKKAGSLDPNQLKKYFKK